MNTKKAIWTRRPKTYIEISLHSFSFRNDGEAAVFFTVGEEGAVRLKAEAEGQKVEYILLHTPSDKVVFSSEGISASFFGLESYIPLKSFGEIEMSKIGETIEFKRGEELLYSMKNPAFLGSASFGARVLGQGKVDITVF